jgi:uroporphyrinogen decarboxylase
MATQLELFRATMNHERHDGFLFYAGFTADLERRFKEHIGIGEKESIQEHFGMYRPAFVNMVPPKDFVAPDFSKYFEGVPMPPGSYIDGKGTLHVPGSMHHFTHYVAPLRNATTMDDLERFIYPNVRGYDDSAMKGHVDAAHAAGRVAACSITHMYEEAWQIRGYEEFLIDIYERPQFCDFILDRLKERNLAKAVAAAKAGVDYLHTGDDVANQNTLMFSIDHWRSLMKSRWAEVYSAAKAIKPDIKVWYHSDGNITSIVDELIEIGVDILNPVQPECVDVEDLAKRYGDRLVFDGTIGTQTTMPFGTPDEVRRVIRDRKRMFASGGALILSPTHVLEPEVPFENILAFIDESKRA